MRPSEGTIEDVLDFINAFEPSSVEDGRLTVRVLPAQVVQAPPAGSSSDDSDDHEDSELLAHSEWPLCMLDSGDRVSPIPLARESKKSEQWPVASQQQQQLPTASTQETTRTRRRNTYREKMRHELDYLRTRAVELEDKLATLRGGTSTALSLSKKSKSSTPRVAFNAVWTRMARNQLEFRMRSEAGNRRLRKEVQLCFEVSQSISDALNRRQSFSSELESKHALKRRRKFDGEYAARFATLVADLDANYARTDGVLRDAGIASTHSDRARAAQLAPQLSPNGELLRSVELAAISTFPFHAQMVTNALWRAIAHWNTTRSVSWLHQDEALFMAHGLAEYTVPDGSTVTYPFATAMKKHTDTENSRWVIVWRSHTELNGLTDVNGDVTDYYADESGWASVEPLVGPTAVSNGSLCRSCIQFVHREKENGTVLDADSPAAHELTNVASMIGTQDAGLIGKMMESLLLDEVNAATNNVGGSSNSDAQARGRR
ncbi:hypothetical protein Gpo141_00001958 [Globisporangium polare]